MRVLRDEIVDCLDFREKIVLSYDFDFIKQIRDDMFNNCSIVVHKDEVLEYMPNGEKFKNVNRLNFVGVNDYGVYCVPLYRYQYDEFIYICPFVSLVDGLLRGNNKNLIEIINYPDGEVTSLYDRYVEELDMYINSITINNIDLKIKKLNELKLVLLNKDLNINKVTSDLYVSKLKKSIDYEVVRSRRYYG